MLSRNSLYFLLLLIAILYFQPFLLQAGENKITDDQHPVFTTTETVFDFGIAGLGKQIVHSFSFTNTGTAPLILSGIDCDCNLSASVTPDRKLPPGENGTIILTLQTPNYGGQHQAKAIVTSNDPKQPSMELTLKGTVQKGLGILPDTIGLGSINQNQRSVGMARIVQLSDNNLILTKIDSPDSLIVRSNRFSDINSRGYVIEVETSGPLSAGLFCEVITLHTNHTVQQKIDIPVWANVVNE